MFCLGETVTLFKWDLDECTKDEWGGTEEENLSAGKYTMQGRFRPQGGGPTVTVRGRFRTVRT